MESGLDQEDEVMVMDISIVGGYFSFILDSTE